MDSRTIPSEKFNITDINHKRQVDAFMIRLADDLTGKINELLDQGAKRIELTYINVLDRDENPLGEIGHINITGVRP